MLFPFAFECEILFKHEMLSIGLLMCLKTWSLAGGTFWKAVELGNGTWLDKVDQ